MLGVAIEITSNTATPTLNQLIGNIAPQKLNGRIGPALAGYLRRYFPKLGRNQKGYPSTNFWFHVGDSVDYIADGSGVTVFTRWQGARQRYEGGPIRAVKGKYLTIPANALAAGGHVAGDFKDLKFVQFGRGQDSPKALVRMVPADAGKQGRGKKSVPAGTEGKKTMVVMYWLKESVNQPPNHKVLPTDAEFYQVIEDSVRTLLPK